MFTNKTIYYPVQHRWNSLKEILIIAGKYGGDLYGSFVYDILVPSLEFAFDELNVNCADIINLRFGTEEQKKAFLTVFTYSIDDSRYEIFRGGVHICTFDIIVESTFPQQLFNIDRLIATVKVEGISFYSHGNESASELIQSINEKKAQVVSNWVQLLNDDKTPNVSKTLKPKFEKLCSNGWKIIHTTIFDGDNCYSKFVEFFNKTINDDETKFRSFIDKCRGNDAVFPMKLLTEETKVQKPESISQLDKMNQALDMLREIMTQSITKNQ